MSGHSWNKDGVTLKTKVHPLVAERLRRAFAKAASRPPLAKFLVLIVKGEPPREDASEGWSVRSVAETATLREAVNACFIGDTREPIEPQGNFKIVHRDGSELSAAEAVSAAAWLLYRMGPYSRAEISRAGADEEPPGSSGAH